MKNNTFARLALALPFAALHISSNKFFSHITEYGTEIIILKWVPHLQLFYFVLTKTCWENDFSKVEMGNRT